MSTPTIRVGHPVTELATGVDLVKEQIRIASGGAFVHAGSDGPPKRALGEFVVEGIHTTIPLHLNLRRDSPFKEGAVDTKCLERTMFPRRKDAE